MKKNLILGLKKMGKLRASVIFFFFSNTVDQLGDKDVGYNNFLNNIWIVKF